MTNHPLLLPLLLLLASPAWAQPCVPTTTFGPDGGSYIARVQAGTIDNITTFTPGQSYQDYIYSGPGTWTRVEPGATLPISITAGPFVGTHYAVWIDIDDNDDLDGLELVGSQQSTSAGQVMSFSYTLPDYLLPGTVRLRVRAAFNMTTPDPCANFLYGETEDYLVVIDQIDACLPMAHQGTTEGDRITAIDLAGAVYSNTDLDAYLNRDFLGGTLDLAGSYSISVVSGDYAANHIAVWIDWDGSGELGDDPSELIGDAFTNSPFETVTFPFLVPVAVNPEPRQVRVRIRLWYGPMIGPCDDTDYGQTIDLTAALQVPNCPCLPVVSTVLPWLPMGAVELDGFSYASAGPNTYPFYAMNFTVGPALEQGSSHVLTVNTSDGSTVVHAWLDLNGDNDLSDPGEYLGDVIAGIGGGLVSIPFTIPPGTPVGHHFLRVRTTYTSHTNEPDGCAPLISTLGVMMDLRVTIVDPAGPCIPQNNYWTLYDDFVDGVVLNTLSNTGTGARFGTEYNDYTGLSTTLDIGSTYTASITSGNSSPNGLGVWIDWNNDQDLDDAGEAIGQTITSGPNATFNTTFAVPAVTPGPKRMRVRGWYGTSPTTACGTEGWGETEDYTVHVQTNTGIANGTVAHVELRPSSDGQGMLLLVDHTWMGGRYQVLDATGRMVLHGSVTSQPAPIPCAGLADATYVVRLTQGDHIWTERFVWTGH